MTWVAPPIKCRSWLACDGITSVYLRDRVASIAGKPAPTLSVPALFFSAVQNHGRQGAKQRNGSYR